MSFFVAPFLDLKRVAVPGLEYASAARIPLGQASLARVGSVGGLVDALFRADMSVVDVASPPEAFHMAEVRTEASDAGAGHLYDLGVPPRGLNTVPTATELTSRPLSRAEGDLSRAAFDAASRPVRLFPLVTLCPKAAA